jgi:hypothetical protein
MVGLTAVGLTLAIWLVFGLAAILVALAVVATVGPATAMGRSGRQHRLALPSTDRGIGPPRPPGWRPRLRRRPWDDAVISALALHAVVLTNAPFWGSGDGQEPAPRAMQK